MAPASAPKLPPLAACAFAGLSSAAASWIVAIPILGQAGYGSLSFAFFGSRSDRTVMGELIVRFGVIGTALGLSLIAFLHLAGFGRTRGSSSKAIADYLIAAIVSGAVGALVGFLWYQDIKHGGLTSVWSPSSQEAFYWFLRLRLVLGFAVIGAAVGISVVLAARLSATVIPAAAMGGAVSGLVLAQVDINSYDLDRLSTSGDVRAFVYMLAACVPICVAIGVVAQYTRPSTSDSSAWTAPLPMLPSGTFVVTIGDIGVTADSIVTPNGTAPLAGSIWIVQDASQTQRKTPTWAIVVAIMGALLCLLGLFFLLVKKEVVVGYASVTVSNGPFQHLTQIPVSSASDVNRVRQNVAQAQQLATRSPA